MMYRNIYMTVQRKIRKTHSLLKAAREIEQETIETQGSKTKVKQALKMLMKDMCPEA